MVQSASLFSQILKEIDRKEFSALVEKHGTERYAKGFSSWDHFVAMEWCQLAQSKSLREISLGLSSCGGKLKHLGLGAAPARSTLAYANEHRTYKLFESVFHLTLKKIRSKLGQTHKFRFKRKLYSIDGTVIDLCASVFNWADYKRAKGGVKLHLLLDHDGYLPAFAVVTTANDSELEVAHSLSLKEGSIVVMDRGYFSFDLFREWTNRGICFVTRLKKNIQVETVRTHADPKGAGIVEDRIVRGASSYLKKKECPELRVVTVRDEETGKEIQLLTNNTSLAASTISAIYRDRWEIEKFFRLLKQNLRVKTFVGTSANALKIQIWAALIAILLIKYLKELSKTGWSVSNLVAVLHLNLLTYKNLDDWLRQPFEAESENRPPGGAHQQLLPGLG